MRRLARKLTLCLGVVLGTSPAFSQDASGVPAFDAAVAAMADADWDTAYSLADATGPVARDLVTWTRLRDGAGTFADYAGFLAARPDWPGLERIRAEAELAMPADLDPAVVVAFFADAAPQTGEGVVRLAQALAAQGEADAAQEAVIAAWTGLGLTETGHATLLAAYADLLAPYHGARTDAMLWRWRTTDAARLLPLLSADDRALAEARIALIDNAGDAATRIAAVPEALRDDPGLAYDRFNRLAQRGDYSDATALLLERTEDAAKLGQPFRWASWRATLARWAMREGRPGEAYRIATTHHLTEGTFYADLEWLAGYLALTYLDDPALALTHFDRLADEVSSPISASRAGYWQGRAHEALGQGAEAATAYGRAARHQTAFYGLLAAEKLGLPLDPALTGREQFPDWSEADFVSGDLAQALLLLLGAGERGPAVQFTAELARRLERTELAQLGALLAEMDEPFLVVLVGKTAVTRGIVLPAIYFPLHPMAEMDLPVAPELALSIARRESEFNHVIGSPVGALGLMQLMPGTAQEVATGLGLPYSRARLTADWPYNAVLGTRYLAGLIETFGQSPVLVAAGYNAGPGRPRTWITQRGDPRDGSVDVIDWIEHIPFEETRNYVMRVTESIPVYRARLSGETGTLDFTALLNGARPLIRPQARPEAAPEATVVVPTATAPLRPQARPGN